MSKNIHHSSTSSFISICSWNVGGLISRTFNKLNDPCFRKEISPYDIVFLCETHTGFDTQIDIDGFQHIPICRPVSTNNRYYGGLALLIRKTLRNGVKLLKNTSSEFQWVKLSKDHFGFDKDLFICFSYISPCVFHNKSDSDSLEAIIRDIHTLKNSGHILLCGDLNARTGLDLDFVQNDNDKHIPLDPSYIIDSNVLQRCSEDVKVDDRGKQVNELCISSRMRILNGRILGDSFGKFTCQKPTGASVVDYMVASDELLKDINYFHVHPFMPLFSDCHSKISVSIKSSVINKQSLNNKNEKMPDSFKWNKYSSAKFKKAIEDKEITNKIKEFINSKFSTTETEVNRACNLFEGIILDVAKKSLKYKNVTKYKKKHNKWFDEDLFVKRRLLTTKANLMFKQPFDLSLRNAYFKQYREYRKLLKFKKKNYTKNVFSKLDELESNDPKAYWNLVNSLKHENENHNGPEMNIQSDTWQDYFQNLNSVQSKFDERLTNLNKILVEDKQIKSFTLLDATIKDKEIKNSINKLKNNKASGLDTIRNEMLKSGASKFLPCLTKIFNLIFSSGCYPTSWAMGYITPIYKTGDNLKPENYRGITITSNIGKLFNMVLNSRLDIFLEENQIIDNVQIGFTKNARTSDHMFVLKSLIDKYTSINGGRLYSCFVDFHKAFDSVIHPALQIKLKELNINGKFYDILTSLYDKSKICVRLGDYHTKSFESKVGVRQGDVLSPNLFKIFINDLPLYLNETSDPVFINNLRLNCLMYADDIVLMSTSATGLQEKLNRLNKFCQDWCLEVNIVKTKVLIFNKSGKLLQSKFYFNEDCLENVKHYRYLGVYFSASGIFNYGQDDIFKKSMKASFKLTKLITSGEPSIKTSLHLYDHLIKPIVLYGSEIWGIFKTSSAACMKTSTFILNDIYKNNIADRSQVKYLKYILGVNKYSSNLAVLSETGRFPMYFSIIISVVKYLFRLENTSNELLKQSYSLAKSLHYKGIQTWYTSAIYMMKILNLDISSCRNLSESQLINIVKKNLIKGFKKYWDQERDKNILDGKLDTYFSIKTDFCLEPYLMVEQFQLRKAISKLRISSHNLLIEAGRYTKPKRLQRSERICKHCSLNRIENEFHFLTECSLYTMERNELFNKVISSNNNFASLRIDEKAKWLMIQESKDILNALGMYIHRCFEKRNKDMN